MKKNLCKTTLLTALLSVAIFLGGCNVFSFFAYLVAPADRKITIPAQYDGIKNRRVTVMIIADEALIANFPYLRLQLATAINSEIDKHIEGAKTTPPSQVVRYQDGNLNYEDMTPRELAERFDSDLLLQVTLMDYGLREPGSSNLYRGRISAEVDLYDATQSRDKRRVWHSDDISVSHPEHGRPLARIDGNIREIRYRTDQQFAQRLVKNFRTYSVERMK